MKKKTPFRGTAIGPWRRVVPISLAGRAQVPCTLHTTVLVHQENIVCFARTVIQFSSLLFLEYGGKPTNTGSSPFHCSNLQTMISLAQKSFVVLHMLMLSVT